MTLTARHIEHAVRLVLGNRASICYALAMTVMFGSIIAYVGMVQQIFADCFHRAALMPRMFALCAGFMGLAAFLNSRLVERLGMRPISHAALLVFIGVAALHALVALAGLERLWTFVALQSATLACVGLSTANFGAMAMEPVGSVAGVAASLQGFISTFGAALVAVLIGREFNGTTVPLAVGGLACGLASLLCVLGAEKGRLFRRQHVADGAHIESAAIG
jgi:DHA1 family bicyclomycin/chloramphenicol resistance-like MFS transporter